MHTLSIDQMERVSGGVVNAWGKGFETVKKVSRLGLLVLLVESLEDFQVHLLRVL